MKLKIMLIFLFISSSAFSDVKNTELKNLTELKLFCEQFSSKNYSYTEIPAVLDTLLKTKGISKDIDKSYDSLSADVNKTLKNISAIEKQQQSIVTAVLAKSFPSYIGKTILVEGRIVNIGKDINGNAFIQLDNNIKCIVTKSLIEKAQPNSLVVIKGTVNRSGSDIVINSGSYFNKINTAIVKNNLMHTIEKYIHELTPKISQVIAEYRRKVIIQKSEQLPPLPKNPNIIQNGKREGMWTILYDVEWKETEILTDARYYRIINYKEGNPDGLVIDYYINGNKQGEEFLKSENPDVFADGLVKWYYPNGQIKEEVTHQNDEINGMLKCYDLFGGYIEIPYKNDKIEGIPNAYDKYGWQIPNSYFTNDWFHTDTFVNGFVRDIKISKKGVIYITNQHVYQNKERDVKEELPHDLYVSYDMGLTWKKRNNPDDRGMGKLVLLDDGTLLTPTYQYGEYGFKGLNMTTDDGETWEAVEIDKSNDNIIHFVEAFGNEIYVLKGEYQYISKDWGGTWLKTSINIEQSNNINMSGDSAINFVVCSGSELYGVTSKGRILKSVDHGKNWTCIRESGGVGLQIAIDGIGVLWAVRTDDQSYEIYSTSDGGKSWQESNNNFSECKKYTPGFCKIIGNPHGGFFICSTCGLSNGNEYLYSGISAFDTIERIGSYDKLEPSDNMDYAGIQCVAYHPDGFLFVGTRGRGVFYNNPLKHGFPAF